MIYCKAEIYLLGIDAVQRFLNPTVHMINEITHIIHRGFTVALVLS